MCILTTVVLYIYVKLIYHTTIHHSPAFSSRAEEEEYRPGQVFSLNAQELLELQPERKAPIASNQQLQQLYTDPQQEHKHNLQQFYYLEPQSARQVRWLKYYHT